MSKVHLKHSYFQNWFDKFLGQLRYEVIDISRKVQKVHQTHNCISMCMAVKAAHAMWENLVQISDKLLVIRWSQVRDPFFITFSLS